MFVLQMSNGIVTINTICNIITSVNITRECLSKYDIIVYCTLQARKRLNASLYSSAAILNILIS